MVTNAVPIYPPILILSPSLSSLSLTPEKRPEREWRRWADGRPGAHAPAKPGASHGRAKRSRSGRARSSRGHVWSSRDGRGRGSCGQARGLAWPSLGPARRHARQPAMASSCHGAASPAAGLMRPRAGARCGQGSRWPGQGAASVGGVGRPERPSGSPTATARGGQVASSRPGAWQWRPARLGQGHARPGPEARTAELGQEARLAAGVEAAAAVFPAASARCVLVSMSSGRRRFGLYAYRWVWHFRAIVWLLRATFWAIASGHAQEPPRCLQAYPLVTSS